MTDFSVMPATQPGLFEPRHTAGALIEASGLATMDLGVSASATRVPNPLRRTFTPGAVVRPYSDVEPTEVKWLWKGRIPLGKVTLIAGDPGQGKSFVTLDLASRVSRGAKWPESEATAPKGSVLLIGAEDDAGDTVVPRLIAAGADLTRVKELRGVRRTQADRHNLKLIDLGLDLHLLEKAIQDLGDCRALIVDPLSAYIGNTNSYNYAKVLEMMAPLALLAAKHEVAIIGISHLRKSGGAAIQRSLGSMGFTASVRAVHMVVRDPDDLTGARRLFLPVKNNLGNDREGMAFTLASPADGAGAACVVWDPEPVLVSVDEVLEKSKDKDGSALENAKKWLAAELADGDVPAKEIRQRAMEDGIKDRTLDRAKKLLGVLSRKDGFEGGTWKWSLPNAEATEAPDASAEPTHDDVEGAPQQAGQEQIDRPEVVLGQGEDSAS